MNVLKKVLIALFATVVVIVLISYLLPGRIHVERSISIHAPPERIHDKIATLRTWKEWTAWNPTAYPDMTWEYKGPESGVGAESSWKSKEGGNGHLIITKTEPKKGVDYDLTFEGVPTIPGGFAFTPDGQPTKVVWAFDYDSGLNPMNRYFCYFFMDSLVGKDFATGLAGLKKAVETEAPAEDKSADVETSVPAKQD